jgi:stearoyl-CoA desaturase (delta-9 desaturase)
MGIVLDQLIVRFRQWTDRFFILPERIDQGKRGIHWRDNIPFVLFHVAPIGVIWVGWSLFAVLFAVLYYIVRMFAITAFYHRYFPHHAFTTNRFFQFLFAFWGISAMQNGPFMVGGHPSSPSYICGYGKGPPFPQDPGIFMEPYRLDIGG